MDEHLKNAHDVVHDLRDVMKAAQQSGRIATHNDALNTWLTCLTMELTEAPDDVRAACIRAVHNNLDRIVAVDVALAEMLEQSGKGAPN